MPVTNRVDLLMIIVLTDHFIVTAELVAVFSESGDVINQLTSEVRLKITQSSAGLAHLLLQRVPTVAQRVDTLRLVASHSHLQLL